MIDWFFALLTVALFIVLPFWIILDGISKLIAWGRRLEHPQVEIRHRHAYDREREPETIIDAEVVDVREIS
jgi:hypothetical protein